MSCKNCECYSDVTLCSNSILYKGGTLSCSGIKKNDSLDEALAKLDYKICTESGGGGGGGLSSFTITSTELIITGSPVSESSTAVTISIPSRGIGWDKLPEITSGKILGRWGGTNGNVQEISLGTGLSLTGSTLNATTASGSVTSVGILSSDLSVSGSPITSSGNITLNINNSAVTYAKIQNIPNQRILGRYSASTGIVQEIQIGSGLALNVSTGVLSATGSSGSSCFDTIATYRSNPKTTFPASSNYYISLGGDDFSSISDDLIIPFSSSGVVKSIVIYAYGTQAANGGLTILLMKGNTSSALADTPISVTIPANTTVGRGLGIYSNFSSTTSISAGDFGVLKAVNNSTSSSIKIVGISLTITN